MRLVQYGRGRAYDPGPHFGDEELEQYSLGDPDDPQYARIEEHLLVCEDCRLKLQRQEPYLEAIKCAAAQWRAEYSDEADLAADRAQPRGAGWPWTSLRPIPWLAAAAAALICLGLVAALRSHVARTPPAFAISLTTTRGLSAGQRAPANRPLELQPDLTGLASFPHYGLRLVDRIGSPLAEAEVGISRPARIGALDPGVYFVRLYSPSGELLREYALEVM